MFKVSISAFKACQHVLFPPACPICGSVAHQEQGKHVETNPYPTGCCRDCLSLIHVFPPHTCQRCGTPMPTSLSPGPCGLCLQNPPAQQRSQSLYVYQGAVRDALLAWKLQGQGAGVDWLLQSAAATLNSIFSADDLLIPVPMPLSRMQKSGLHHSADLCQSIARITGCTIDWQLLRRSGEQPRQSALKGRERMHNLRKAFTLSNDYPSRLENHASQGKIWVVDDILTTGATLRHACQAMLPTKHDVFAFSLARVNHHQ